MSALARLGAACVLTTSLLATPAYAESTTIEINPNGLHLGEPVVLKNSALAAVLAVGVPLAVSAPLLVLKPGALATTLFYAAPAFAGVGSLYAGDPWHALSIAGTGPACVLAGWGAGLLLAKAGGLSDATAIAGYGSSGMTWGYGLFLAWALTDAYLTSEIQNKKALGRAGIYDNPL